MFLKTVPVLLFVGAAAFVTSSSVHDTRAAKIPVVTVHAKDFSVDAPTPTVHLVLKDYGFVFSKPLHAGKNVIHVMNEGPQDHEAVFVKLAPGKHIADVSAWVTKEGMKGPPPGMPIDGMASLAKGRTGIFTANLTPGTYGLICFISDAKDHKEHSLHGMTSEFTVK